MGFIDYANIAPPRNLCEVLKMGNCLRMANYMPGQYSDSPDLYKDSGGLKNKLLATREFKEKEFEVSEQVRILQEWIKKCIYSEFQMYPSRIFYHWDLESNDDVIKNLVAIVDMDYHGVRVFARDYQTLEYFEMRR